MFPNQQQEQAISCTDPYVAVVSPYRGSGATTALLLTSLSHCRVPEKQALILSTDPAGLFRQLLRDHVLDQPHAEISQITFADRSIVFQNRSYLTVQPINGSWIRGISPSFVAIDDYEALAHQTWDIILECTDRCTDEGTKVMVTCRSLLKLYEPTDQNNCALCRFFHNAKQVWL